MPYVDSNKQSAYQVAWVQARRNAWFAENGPCVDCSSWKNLRVDHVDASQKISHLVFSWSESRRNVELAKCVPRCYPCHVVKTVAHKENARGSQIGNSVLSEDVVREARNLYATGQFTWPQLGKKFNVKHNTLRRACKDWWRHVED